MILEIVTSLFLAWLVWFFLTTYRERRSAPPGPFPLPLIGNLHQLGSNLLVSLGKLFDKYGDVYQIKLPLGTFVVLNSAEVLLEAVRNKKDDFAGKPAHLFYPVNEIVGGKNIASADYGPGLILRRKVFRTALNACFNGTDKIQPRVSAAVGKFLAKIESMDGEPFQIKDPISTAIVSHLWDWMSSKNCDFDDDMVKLISELHENMEYLFRNGSLYNMLPFLTYLPTKFMKTLKKTEEMREKIWESEFHDHILSHTESVRDLTDGLIVAYKKEKSKNSEDLGTLNDMKFLMVDIVVTGIGTSRTVLEWSIFVIASDLDLQVKLQNELDEVVGRDRLPNIEDINNLHKLQAAVCEVLRYLTIVPLIFRKTVRDTSIKGCFIPENTNVILNIYQSSRNPKGWDEPTLFKPNRFLDKNGHFLGWGGIRAYFLPFGYGHRSCLGEDFGRKIVFALLSSLLHRYTLDLPEDVVRFRSDGEGLHLFHAPKDYKVIAKKRQLSMEN